MTKAAALQIELERLSLNLNLHKVRDGYQANLEVSPGSFRICHGATAFDALCEVLRVRDDSILPPPPY